MAIAALSFVGCQQSPNRISDKQIVKQFNQELSRLAVAKNFVEVQTGKYECNSEAERLQLRQLEAAGLLTYKVDRYAWWEKSIKNVRQAVKVKKYNYWYGYYDDTEYRWVKGPKYEFCDHYIVDVELTGRGRSISVSELPEAEKTVDKDLQSQPEDVGSYAWNRKDLSENWPEIKNPFVEEKTDVEADAVRNATSAKKNNEKKSDKPVAKDNTERRDSLVFDSYSKVQTVSDIVYLKSYEVEAVKARNIQISLSSGTPVATAEVVVKTTKVTDAGRIIDEVQNNERTTVDVVLRYYVDRGWVIDRFDDIDL